MTRDDVVAARVATLTSGFGHFMQVYDDRVSPTSKRLEAHRTCLELLAQAGSAKAAVHDDRFVQALRRVLLEWKVGRRASRIVPEDVFAAAMRAALSRLESLEHLTIDAPELPTEVPQQVWELVESLGVVENQAKIVAGTKTLHHLLPELVVPMDRRWTGDFFQPRNEWQQPASQRRLFLRAYGHLKDVARQVQPEQYATGRGWRTCRTKIIDNALIGFCMEERDATAGSAEERNRITFMVPGAPPIKDGAMSVFGATHAHAARVRDLLEKASQALARQDFERIDAGLVSLEVILHTSPGEALGDATNYLGGIADVLEDKAHRPLDHLDGLGGVWLYRNDRQIKHVYYREVEASRTSYQVTVRSLPPVR